MKLVLLALLFQYSSFAIQECPSELNKAYSSLKISGEKLAGKNEDIAQRVEVYKKIYQDPSHHGQFHFPLIAAHGAKWLESMIPTYNQQIVDVLASSWTIFNKEKETRKKARASGAFIGKLLRTNKQVFIDTYSLYYFIKKYRSQRLAKTCLKSFWPQDRKRVTSYFSALTQIFERNNLSQSELRNHYYTALIFEQESMVFDEVTRAFKEYRKIWKVGSTIAKSPTIQFSYFPKDIVFNFSDFSQTDERVHYAMKSYDIAINYSSSMQMVYDALSYYP